MTLHELKFIVQNAGWATLNPGDAAAAKSAMRRYRLAHPLCEISGSDKNVQVHHIIPVWSRPDLAADPDNLISLSAGAHIHLLWGHDGNFARRYVENIRELAEQVQAIRKKAVVVERPQDPTVLSSSTPWWRRFVDWVHVRRSLAVAVLLLLLLPACATRQPGGRADRWATHSFYHNDVIYNGVGVRF